MGNQSRYLGVNFNNLRKALYLMFFGVDLVKDKNGKVKALSQDFNSPKYRYIIPMQGNFENPLELQEKDTYIMYWILVRFIGKEAEEWVKSFRHLAKRNGVTEIWSGVCNAERLEYTSPVVPRKISYSGLNSQIAFDVRFKLYYDEVISTGWLPLKGINMNFISKVTVED